MAKDKIYRYFLFAIEKKVDEKNTMRQFWSVLFAFKYQENWKQRQNQWNWIYTSSQIESNCTTQILTKALIIVAIEIVFADLPTRTRKVGSINLPLQIIELAAATEIVNLWPEIYDICQHMEPR